MNNHERKLFWKRANSAYAELRKNPIAWKEEQEERLAWDATLADGLEKKNNTSIFKKRKKCL